MEKIILKTINENKLIENGEKVVLAVSGGPDSMFMLDNLRKISESKKINFEIIVAHLNHMIREEAIDDENYVKNYCENYNIKFYVRRADATQYAKENKMGLEEAGRKLRYDFFEEIFKKENADKIAVAHNKNDKAETIIMNILRGSGLAGLKGIEFIRDKKYIRPILNIERQEIEKYCQENKLEPRIDKTNFVNDCTRNKIRNIVIPYIKSEFNSNIIESMNRLAKIVKEEEEYMMVKTIEEYNKILIQEKQKEIILDLKQFNLKENVIKKRIIIYGITKILGSTQNIEMVNLEDIIKLCEKNVGNKFLKPNKNIKILVNKGKIFFVEDF